MESISSESIRSPHHVCRTLTPFPISWEYPNHQGIGCNTIAPDDSANFLLFLQQLRQDPVAANITLTAAVGQTPFAGSDGTPTADVSAFATVLNHIGMLPLRS